MSIRSRLGIRGGDELEVEMVDGTIVLRPSKRSAKAVQEGMGMIMYKRRHRLLGLLLPPLLGIGLGVPNGQALTVAPGEKGILALSDDYTSAQQDYALNDLKSMNTQWVRIAQSWAAIEPTKGRFNWSHYDRLVPKIVSRGIKPMIEITFDTPAWARPVGSTVTTVPTDLAGFADFCTRIAQRYAPQGVHAWEIFNEAIFNNSAAAYGPVLKAAYQAIKAADPDAEIITSGNPVDKVSKHGSGVSWLQDLYDLGYGPYITAVGAHPYDYSTLPSRGGNWRYMEGNDPSLRSVMIAHGDGAKKIWVTEYGYPSCSPKNSAWTESREAQYLQDAYATLQKKSWAGPLMWYSYRDHGTTKSTPENCYGIVRKDFTLKALPYNAYKGVSARGAAAD
jgi:hypothetical protein